MTLRHIRIFEEICRAKKTNYKICTKGENR